jgi:hypothetical protein
MLSRLSFANLGLTLGGILSIIGILAYVTGNATLNLAGFFYGFPLFLGGLAFKIAELKPAPYTQPTPPEVAALRERQATPIQQQLRRDVTRYRYGQSIHMDVAIARIGLTTRKDDLPELTGLSEIATDGAYTLVLEFNSPEVPFSRWKSQQGKIETFFGPGIQANLAAIDDNSLQSDSDLRVRLSLIAVPQPSSE